MSKKNNYANAAFDHAGNFDLEATIDDRRYFGEPAQQYEAPERDQKWRARELFGFMWRHLGIKIPQGYRDVMLLLIEKANAVTGQLNWRQSKMAELTLLSRQYINEACKWWAEETPFLKKDRRKTRMAGLSAMPTMSDGNPSSRPGSILWPMSTYTRHGGRT